MKLSAVTTPYIKQSPKENTARRSEKENEEGVMCQWCRHAFRLETAVEVPFTEGRVVHCTWCDRPHRVHELMEVQTLAGQASRSKKKKDKRDLPSLASADDEEHIDDADLPTVYGSGTEDNTNTATWRVTARRRKPTRRKIQE